MVHNERKLFALFLSFLFLLPCLCFKTHHNFLDIPRKSWRVYASKPFKQETQKVTKVPFHLLHTDACSSVGGGYYLNGESYSQFRWTTKEKYRYGAKRLVPMNRTDIRMLEFVTAVVAIYNERNRLRNSCVELRIDNCGAWKWLDTRKMNHLWGQGWMRLLQSLCRDYNIDIRPVIITGACNPVADALSRFKTPEVNGVDFSVLRGTRPVVSPGPAWREVLWMNSNQDLYRGERGKRRSRDVDAACPGLAISGRRS
jgi:hypothetical protein